jgi:hypothetical protein
MNGGAHEVDLEPGEYSFGGNAAADARVEKLLSQTPAVTVSMTVSEPTGDPRYLASPRRKSITREAEPAKQVWQALPVGGFTVAEAGAYRVTQGRGALTLYREEE